MRFSAKYVAYISFLKGGMPTRPGPLYGRVWVSSGNAVMPGQTLCPERYLLNHDSVSKNDPVSMEKLSARLSFK